MSAHDINFAAHVQNAFLPETPKDLVDWDIAVFFRPTRGVSGDCYDFYQKEKNLKGLSIFDVSGHGLSSGLLTMIVKPSMMRYFNQMSKYALGRILSKVNESIVGEFSVIENYITGIVLRFENGSAEYVNAGHPEVVIKRAGEVKAAPIQEGDDCIKGQPIGITRYYEYRSMKFPISQGDTLLLYTDCLVETSDDDGNRYGLKSLTDSMAAAPDGTADMILDHIMFDFFSGTNPDLIEDDLTVIVAKKR